MGSITNPPTLRSWLDIRRLTASLVVICTTCCFALSIQAQPPVPLDPQCQTFIDKLAEQPGPGWDEMGVAKARSAFNSFTDLFGQGPADIQTRDTQLAASVPVRIYRPAHLPSDRLLPVVVYIHGGGWVLGNLETHDALCRRLCDQTQIAVISVDYRLSPEHPHPAPVDDCFAVTKYVAEHGAELNVDGQRLIVAGDSAGGTLTMSVALKARNMHGPKIAGQILIYPAVDNRCDSPSHESFSQGYGLTRADMRWFWQQYLADHKAGAYAVPARAQSLKGLPPTTIVLAGYDVLHDEAELLATNLEKAGVPVKVHRYDDMIHGFVHFAGAFDRGLQATQAISQDIQRYLK